MRNASIVEALANLVPGAEYVIEGDDLDGLTWLDGTITEPSAEAITAEVLVVEAEWETQAHERNRERADIERGATQAAMVEALWRHVMESDSDQANSLQVIRDQVRAEYPTPVQD